jgi:hypothetical protein
LTTGKQCPQTTFRPEIRQNPRSEVPSKELKDPKPFAWTRSADDILETLADYCQRITGAAG